MKKLVSYGLLLLIVSVVMFSTKSEAASLSKTSSGRTFTATWAATASSGSAKLEYGFHKGISSKDVAYANHSRDTHNSAIRNGSGRKVGPTKNAGTWSDLEVTHSGSSITYYCEW